MRLQDSPFRPSWWGTDLAKAGVDARPRVGTYGNYDFAALPPLPFPMTGDLDWLARQAVAPEWSIGSGEVPDDLPALVETCRDGSLSLPEAFLRFMGSTDLQSRVRSSTACFISLDGAPVPGPEGGRLIRFLSDQQGCLYWYLYFTKSGDDHAVVCSDEYYGTSYMDDNPTVEALSYSAESFEAFLCRFWLENEIWFATMDGTSPPDVAPEYIARYRDPESDAAAVQG